MLSRLKNSRSWVKRIVSHQKPDLDARLSIWLVKTLLGLHNVPVVFKPQDYIPLKGDLVLDMQQGIKGPEGGGSCFGVILNTFGSQKERAALRPLKEYVDLVDTGRLPRFLKRLGDVGDIFRETGLLTSFCALQGCRELDERSKTIALNAIFDLTRARLLARYDAQRRLSRGKLRISPCGRVLMVQDDRILGNLSLEDDETIVISRCQGDLSVVTQDDNLKSFDGGAAHQVFRDVVEKVGEGKDWFIHSSGFLYASGTDSRKGRTKVVQEDLFHAAIKFFELYDAQKK